MRTTFLIAILEKHLFVYLILFIVLTVAVSSSLILKFEEPYPNSTINTVPDAIWWSAVGVSTIGIGNVVPESLAGRYLTLFLMIAGLIIFSVITAKVASVFTEEEVKDDLNRDFKMMEEDINRVEKNIENEIKNDEVRLENKVEALEEKLEKKSRRNKKA